MKLLEFDGRRGRAKLVLETLDDLWHLYNLLDKNDLVYSRTTREIKARGESARPGACRRMSLTLGLKVTEALFDKSVSRLRVRGVITEAPEKFEGLLGSYHTHSLEPGALVVLVKERWLAQHLRRLKEACETKSKHLVVVALDDEEACVAVIKRFGFDVKFEKREKLPGKREAEKRRAAQERYFAEVRQHLAQAVAEAGSQVVVLGPGFVKADFVKHLRSEAPELASKIVHVGSASFGGVAGVSEALRSGALAVVAARSRMVEEVGMVEELLGALASGSEKVAYGLDAVQNAALRGAVETLLLADEYLRVCPDEERLRLEEVIRWAERARGRVVIVSCEHEGGEKLLSLGGVAARLRFSVAA